jgi:2-iminobutanoate/2-iminopropanoate deaminase
MPLDAESLSLPLGGIGPETHQAMRNLRALLTAAGSSLSQLVHVTIYLRDWADFAEMNAIYISYLNPPYPARACVEVSTSGTPPHWRSSRSHSPKGEGTSCADNLTE